MITKTQKIILRMLHIPIPHLDKNHLQASSSLASAAWLSCLSLTLVLALPLPYLSHIEHITHLHPYNNHLQASSSLASAA